MLRHRFGLPLLSVSLMCAAPALYAAELGFEAVIATVGACDLDPEQYQGMWSRHDALLINLPSSGTVNGILLTQFYWAPGRDGRVGNYGVVFNAPIEQVAAAFPQYVGASMVNGFDRHLVPLTTETHNPRNRSQTLLVCRGGARL